MHSSNQNSKENIINRLNNIFSNLMYLLGRYLSRVLEKVPAFFEWIEQFFQGWNDEKKIEKPELPIYQ